MAKPQGTHAIEAESRRFEARSSESFDRIAYALELLKVLNPALTVAIYRTQQHLEVDQGQFGSDGPWALLGIPPHAARESIVLAVAELCGVSREPFVVDLLRAAHARSSS